MSSSRSGVLGFTEAELGLFLAIIFMGVAAFGAGTPTPPAVPNRPLSADSSRFAIVARLAAERDSLARVLVRLGSRTDSLNSNESRLATRRDSLTATPEGGTSAERARRIALADSLGRALDSVRVAKAAIDADKQLLRETQEKLENQMEPLVRSEAALLASARTARRARDSVISRGRPGDSVSVRRLAAIADSIGTLAADPQRRTAPTASAPATVATAAPAPVTTRAAPDADGTSGSGRGRSNQVPTCTELGVASGPIATVAIIGAGQYRVRGRDGSLQTVISTLAREQAAAEKARCRQIVRVTTVLGLAVEAYVPALVELRRIFNTSLLGPNE